MKQLIYKDWILSRKTTIITMIYCSLIALTFLLIRISANCGNLSHDPMFYLSLKRNMYIMRYMPCAVFFLVLVDNGSIVKDYNCGWMRLCRTTGIKTEAIVASKLVYSLISISAAIVPVMIYTVSLCIADGSGITFGQLKNLCTIYFITLTAAFLYTFLSFLLKKAYLVQLVMLAAVGTAAGLMMMHLFNRINKLSAEPVADFDLLDLIRMEYAEPLSRMLPVIFIITAAVFAICFFASVKILKRREMP